MPHIPPLAPPLTVSRILEPTAVQPAVARRQPTIPPTSHAPKASGSGRLPAVPIAPASLGSGARPLPVPTEQAPAGALYDDEDELTRVADHPHAAARPAGSLDPRRAPTMPAMALERAIGQPAGVANQPGRSAAAANINVVRAPAAFPPAPLSTRPHDAKVVVRHESVARALPPAANQAAPALSGAAPVAAARRDSAPAPNAATFPFPYAIESRPALDTTSKALIALIIVLLAGLIVIVMLLIQRR